MREAGAGLRGATGRMRLAWLRAERLVSDTRNSVRRPEMRIGAPASRRESRQTSFHPAARERASQKARYWPSACE